MAMQEEKKEGRKEGEPGEMRSQLAFEPHRSMLELVQPMDARLQEASKTATMQLAGTGEKLNEQIP